MSTIALNARYPFTAQPAREPSKNDREPSSLEERIQALTRIIKAPISDIETLPLDSRIQREGHLFTEKNPKTHQSKSVPAARSSKKTQLSIPFIGQLLE